MSSKIKQKPFQILPFPDGRTKFTSNTLVIDNPMFDENDIHEIYDHTGEYVVTASSYSDNTHMPYNVFNGGRVSSWKTNFADNKYVFKTEAPIPGYCKDPYNSSNNGPSSYQGGGSSKTKYVTKVDNIDYKGEWIQIQLPTTSPIYLFRYSITTPRQNDDICRFPRSFLLAGSKDGSNWTYIDLQTLQLNNPPSTSDKTYNVNVAEHYRYLRFIFLDMFPKNKFLEINKIDLYGFITITPNRNAIEEGFDNIDSKFSYSGFEISKDINKPTQHMKDDHTPETNSILYIPLGLTAIIGGLLLFRALRK